MTESKRARRRRDLQRMKAKARRIYGDAAKAAYWADYLAVCSCALCGNPRGVWKGHARRPAERRFLARGADTDA
jgi:hypothetical protein